MVADLVASRQSPRREELARTVPEFLEDLAERYKADFYAPLMPSRGIDELSGVLTHPRSSYRICLELNEAVHPASFRFAVATGRLDVGLDTGVATKMDGPAFHTASDLMETAKKKDRAYLFYIESLEKHAERLLNEVAHLASLIPLNWSERDREIGALYRALGTQKEVAARLQTTQQAISKTLKNMRWHEYQEANQAINNTLSELSKT